MKNLLKNISFRCFVSIFVFASITNYAGTTGKISGTVRDAETGEPLPGCNIIIEGTILGAASKLECDCFNLNIPP